MESSLVPEIYNNGTECAMCVGVLGPVSEALKFAYVLRKVQSSWNISGESPNILKRALRYMCDLIDFYPEAL